MNEIEGWQFRSKNPSSDHGDMAISGGTGGRVVTLVSLCDATTPERRVHSAPTPVSVRRGEKPHGRLLGTSKSGRTAASGRGKDS